MRSLRETQKKIMDEDPLLDPLLEELNIVYPPAQRSVIGVLDFLPEGYDFYYQITDDDNIFRFELYEMESMVSGNQIAECAGEITGDDLLYIDWLGVEKEYQGSKLGYLMLYISGLFALSRGCYRIALSDATESIEIGETGGLKKRTHLLRPHIYKNLCLDHRNPRIDELKEIHARRSSRLNTKWAMVGSLLDLIQRLEGTRDCDPTNPISFEPKSVREKISAKRVELMEMKRKSTDTSSDLDEGLRETKRFKITGSPDHAGAVPKKKTKLTRRRQQRKRQQRQRQQRQRTKRAVKTDQFKKKKKKKGSARGESAGKSIPKKVGRRKKNKKGRR